MHRETSGVLSPSRNPQAVVEMSYYQRRRAEILGSRKRRPRSCDVLRADRARVSLRMQLLNQRRALRRLEAAWAQ